MAIKEIWKPIPGYDGYEASNIGRVRSIDRKRWQKSRWGVYQWFYYKGKVLSPGRSSMRSRTGNRKKYYLMVNLQRSRKPRMRSVQECVMLAFRGKTPKRMWICHNNGKFTDNRLINLRFDTPANNAADTLKHGTHMRGTRNPSAKLTPNKVRAIRRSKLSCIKLARKYGVNPSTIGDILKGNRWGWLDNNKTQEMRDEPKISKRARAPHVMAS